LLVVLLLLLLLWLVLLPAACSFPLCLRIRLQHMIVKIV
jgi:hypothetical protein